MILADTNIFIRFWKQPTPEMQAVFANEKVCSCGITRAELYHGARTPKELDEIRIRLSILTELEIPQSIWPSLGTNMMFLRQAGITVPFADSLLTTVAVHHGVPIWSYDAHFPLIKNVIPALQLFQEQP